MPNETTTTLTVSTIYSRHSYRQPAIILAAALAVSACASTLSAQTASPEISNNQAQNAQVTFYNHGSLITSGMPGAKHGVFGGAIYDGKERLFLFLESRFHVVNNRRLILAVPAGKHQFSASYSDPDQKDIPPAIELSAGQHYYFRALSESSGVFVVEWEKGHLDQVDCKTAAREMDHSKLLVLKHLTPKLSAMIAVDQSLPTCP
jgi:hypothetical protein